MTLAPLATTADLLTRGFDLTNAALALDIASSLVRDAAGCPISAQTSTITLAGTRANLLELPGPVTSVDTVTIDGQTVTDYETLPNGLWRRCGWAHGKHLTQVTVAYTYGLTAVPVDIVDLTCTLAKAWADHQTSGGGSTAGLLAVSIDDAREQYTAEAAGQLTGAFIPEATREWLARRFSGSVAVVETL